MAAPEPALDPVITPMLFQIAMAVIGVALTLLGWALSMLYQSLRQVERDLAQERVFNVTNYAAKHEINARLDQLETKMDRALNSIFQELRSFHRNHPDA